MLVVVSVCFGLTILHCQSTDRRNKRAYNYNFPRLSLSFIGARKWFSKLTDFFWRHLGVEHSRPASSRNPLAVVGALVEIRTIGKGIDFKFGKVTCIRPARRVFLFIFVFLAIGSNSVSWRPCCWANNLIVCRYGRLPMALPTLEQYLLCVNLNE